MSEISFLVDEHIPKSVVEELGAKDVDIAAVYQLDLAASPTLRYSSTQKSPIWL